MITDGMFDYEEHLVEVANIGYIVFVLSIFLIPFLYSYFYKKNGVNPYKKDIFGKTLISSVVITIFTVFFSQLIYYNQEIQMNDLKKLITLEEEYNLYKNQYSKKDVSNIEKLLKIIKKDNQIKTSEYYVLKNKMRNLKKEYQQINEKENYENIKNNFLNTKNNS